MYSLDADCYALPMFSMRTMEELHSHNHTLALYCLSCNRWGEANLDRLIQTAKGNKLVTEARFRCRDCGEDMINTLEYTAELARETAYLYQRVESVIPEIEWPTYAPFVAAINHLKKERNAVILAHNYQTPEIFHCVADITGDSLAVARKAIETDAEIIVLAGVYYTDVTPLSVDPPRPV